MNLARCAIPLPLLMCGSAVLAQPATPFSDIPNVTIAYYDVAGKDAAAIRKALNQVRPTDPNDRSRVDALTRFSYRWRWPRTANDGCALDRAEVTFDATVTLPRLADPAALPKSLLLRWEKYVAALERHEAGHLTNAYLRRDDLLSAIKAATCDTAKPAAQAILTEIRQRDADYDRQTSHGRTQAAVFP